MKSRTPTKRSITGLDYRQIMKEIKHRLDAMSDMESVTARKLIHRDFAEEFLFLQLRMICELISIGCLVAHDEIELTRSGKLTKLWSSKEIIRAMEKLHPDFYPKPTGPALDVNRVPVDPNSGDAEYYDHITGDYLTKTKLLELVGRCGDELHRGTIKSLRKRRVPTPQSQFQKWIDNITTLLEFHEIVISEHQRLWVAMSYGPKTQPRIWQLDRIPNT